MSCGLEESLDPGLFLRIHRSVIVNTSRVRELRGDVIPSPAMSYPCRRYLRDLAENFFTHEASTSQELRRAVEAHCARHAGARRGEAGDLPSELATYVDTVAWNAHEITDDHVAALKDAGWSEEAIFEITLAAALGAGLARLERGLEVLEGGRDAP